MLSSAERFRALLLEQQQHGFQDLAGAQLFATVPISDRLLTRVIAQQMPASAPVRDVDLRAHDGNTLSVRIKLSKPAIMPPITIKAAIERQPDLPSNPVLVLRILTGGALLSLAGSALRMVDVLPPGVTLEGDRLLVDLFKFLAQRGAGELLPFLEQLEIGCEEGRFVVILRAGLPRRAPRADGV